MAGITHCLTTRNRPMEKSKQRALEKTDWYEKLGYNWLLIWFRTASLRACSSLELIFSKIQKVTHFVINCITNVYDHFLIKKLSVN